MNMGKIVYHYCSVESFVSIIQHATLRLSDLYKMNDWSEKRYYGELVINYLQEKYKLAYDIVRKLRIRLEELTNPQREQTVAYAACFSENGDLLTQWETYGNNGCGVNIGFDSDILKKIEINEIAEFKKIKYPQKFSKTYLHTRDVVELCDKSICKEIDIIFLFDRIMKDSFFYKHPSFYTEQEWRLVFTSDKSYCGLSSVSDPIDELYKRNTVYSWKNTCGFEISKPTFFAKNGNLTSYIELNFSSVKSDFVKSIIIGPASKLMPFEVYSFLLSCGYNKQAETDDEIIKEILVKSRNDKVKHIKVEKSELPYRIL